MDNLQTLPPMQYPQSKMRREVLMLQLGPDRYGRCRYALERLATLLSNGAEDSLEACYFNDIQVASDIAGKGTIDNWFDVVKTQQGCTARAHLFRGCLKRDY